MSHDMVEDGCSSNVVIHSFTLYTTNQLPFSLSSSNQTVIDFVQQHRQSIIFFNSIFLLGVLLIITGLKVV
ncbi:hypothetical protein QVD17_03467 [Tagetes erecta]|uniref:Transmembrane protein n=1 Tax=Tagetes erecta TaxID=13708 RepID=A0AAD8PA01_TARER|nr:hypothetical protein QVD17_03467 [Tagetes erecta]